jgi:hypothetical protein
MKLASLVRRLNIQIVPKQARKRGASDIVLEGDLEGASRFENTEETSNMLQRTGYNKL